MGVQDLTYARLTKFPPSHGGRRGRGLEEVVQTINQRKYLVCKTTTHSLPSFIKPTGADKETKSPRGTTSRSLGCPIATTSCSTAWHPWGRA